MNHSFTELGEIFPISLEWANYLNRVGYCNYSIDLGEPMARAPFLYPYRTDYILFRGQEHKLQAGEHVSVGLDTKEDGQLQISGNDYLHYLESIWYPFDPQNIQPAFGRESIDMFTLIEDILDDTLAQSDTLPLTYSNGTSGNIVADYNIQLGDTETLLDKFTTLGEKDPGFDLEITPDRELKLYAPHKGSAKDFTFEDGANCEVTGYTNQGPTATHTLAVLQGLSGKLGYAITSPAAAAYRRRNNSADLNIQTTDTAIIQQHAVAQNTRDVTPRVELSVKYWPDNEDDGVWDLETGDTVKVHADLTWDKVDENMRIVGIQGSCDDEGNCELTVTFDDSTLSL